MKNSPLTDQDKKFIRDNHLEITPQDMGSIIGKSMATIYSHMKKNKISIHKVKKESVYYLREPKKEMV